MNDEIGASEELTVPLVLALREAGAADARCREVASALDERRAANMRLLAADLRSTGRLRADLTDDQVADLVWSMNEGVVRFFSHAEKTAGNMIELFHKTFGLKLVAESYPFEHGGRFLLTFDNHNSVNGIREFARARGGSGT